jgi:hypothetical protein
MSDFAFGCYRRVHNLCKSMTICTIFARDISTLPTTSLVGLDPRVRLERGSIVHNTLE